MKTIITVFAIHNHQHIGNFEKVFERIYQCSIVTPTWKTRLTKEVKYHIEPRVRNL